MCVEYLENLLHEDSYNFDIPELEVRLDSVPVPEISEQMDISDAPPLCECDELGSLYGLCKIARSGDETMTEEVINSSWCELAPRSLIVSGIVLSPPPESGSVVVPDPVESHGQWGCFR